MQSQALVFLLKTLVVSSGYLLKNNSNNVLHYNQVQNLRYKHYDPVR